jgi:GTP-binding protein
MWDKAEFILSASSKKDFPELKDLTGKTLPEVAFVGRSNVGKSSLINHLTFNKRLAHISSKPGKTQLINFFHLNQQLALVDLPGYGFAKVPKTVRHKWGELIQDYLEKRTALLILLCDARHPPTENDLEFARWAAHFKKPLLIVFTKCDKLTRSQVQAMCKRHFAALCENIPEASLDYLCYSIKDAKGRTELIKEIEKRLL